MSENNQNSVPDREQAMRQLLHHLFIILAALIVFCFACVAWFVNNTRVSGQAIQISAAGKPEFALATVGLKEQGVYDSMFDLSGDLIEKTIGDTDYYIASSNSSFRVSSDKNLNNYLANADLRPGNRGSFDLYVICYTDKRELALQPILSAWYETENGTLQDVLGQQAAEFLKGHILLFANMDDKGMYSGNIDLSQEIKINLESFNATQGVRTFAWGGQVYSDENAAVYRLPVYWVWPEQFGNFIYTGNSYNKNLFADKTISDYTDFIGKKNEDEPYTIGKMQSESAWFFSGITTEAEQITEEITSITDPNTDFKTATQLYDKYSGWYNAADEIIGDKISYIGLGFELTQNS